MKRIFLILFCIFSVIGVLTLGYTLGKTSSNTTTTSQEPAFSSKIIKKQDLLEQNSSEEAKDNNNTEQQQINLPEENKNSQNEQILSSSSKNNTTVQQNNMNEYYYERYWEIEAKVESIYDNLYITADLITASGNELAEWDTLLNEVYNYIKGTISSTEFAKLQESERNWIKQRDTNAENAANFDGSMAELEYNSSLITQTKERILWLIDNYI